MARAVTLGNGNILVGIDSKGQVRDFYAPFVGQDNHVSGASGNHVHRIGVFVEGTLSWLDDPGWKVSVRCTQDAVVGSIHAVHEELGVSLTSTDVVHNEYNVFIRTFTLTNESNTSREIKLFFSQQFRISESRRGDTGFYDPRVGAIVHYKGKHTFLVNAFYEGEQFEDYNIGLFGIENKEGTYYDAIDGILERNPIEHGSVDSVIGVTCKMPRKSHAQVEYWIAYGASVDEVHDLNARVIEETPAVLTHSTENYWQAWLSKESRDLSLFSDEVISLYNRSLTTIRVHADNRGGIIASSDTDMLHHGRDTYSYVWPRDASIIAYAMDQCGYDDVARRYFEFIAKRMERGGYLMHKYRTDGMLGSSWHPWMVDGKARLPIQEDETATTLFLLWHHYDKERDVEFIESLYNPFIEPVAQFMCEYIESAYGLPKSSYDLWEEKFGISTYTASSVYGGLLAAAQFANVLGKQEAARTYSAVAQRMRQSIIAHLYDDKLGMWVKHMEVTDDGDAVYDRTIDMSSFYGPLFFGVVEVGDPKVTKSFTTITNHLKVHKDKAGFIRYEKDSYYTLMEAGSPNPWVITTLWVAQYLIMNAQKLKDLTAVHDILEWTCDHAVHSGVLAEQMNPITGEHISTAPLIWSHAEFVLAVNAYVEKHKELSGEL